MKILIKMAIREYQSKFLKLLDACIDKLSNENDYHFLISCDDDDVSMNNKNMKEIMDSYDNLSYYFSPRDTKICACNRDIENVPDDWDVLILLSDDMFPMVDKWDKYISDNMKKFFPDTDGALWFYDGHREDLMTYMILGNKYYKRFNYIFYPKYKSFFSDDEFMIVANRLCRLQICEWPMILFEHQHYSFSPEFKKLSKSEKKNMPWIGGTQLQKENRQTFDDDICLFNLRKKENFKSMV